MKIYYLRNRDKQKSLNAEGIDYTPAYIPALAAYMGITVHETEEASLDTLCEDDLLFVGAQRIEKLPKCNVILLGGKVGKDVIPQKRVRHIYARYLCGKYRLPLFADISEPTLVNAETLAYAEVNGRSVPALVKSGRAYEFCFDLSASVWFSGDGFEPDPEPQYFYILRTPDKRPLPDGDEAHDFAYNDLLIGEIEKILRKLGIPAVYRLLPNENGTPPDAMMHFSGDDDCSGEKINISAALTMEEFGLPYHINAMINPSVGFIFNKDTYNFLISHGCEVALHTNFCGSPYEAETVELQKKRFEESFGVHPYTNTNHCFIQGGSNAQRLRWFEAAGIMADNGKLGEFDPSDINRFGLTGFGFGTSFPRFSLDDPEHENKPFSTIEIPINFYEPRLYEEESPKAPVTDYIDNGVAHGRIIQFFIHPHYICEGGKQREATLRAIRAIKSHISERGYDVLLTTTNKITRFWQDRARAVLEYSENEIKVYSDTPLLLRLPDFPSKKEVLLDDRNAVISEKTVDGERAYLIYVPCGSHTVSF